MTRDNHVRKASFLSLSSLVLFGVASANAFQIMVNTTEDEFDTPSGPERSLREAIRDAGPSEATICFDPSLSGETLTLTMGMLFVTGNGNLGRITIDGSSLDAPLTLSADYSDRLITVSERDLELKGLILSESRTSTQAIGALTVASNADVTLNCVDFPKQRRLRPRRQYHHRVGRRVLYRASVRL